MINPFAFGIYWYGEKNYGEHERGNAEGSKSGTEGKEARKNQSQRWQEPYWEST
jgi:hypothetical protein